MWNTSSNLDHLLLVTPAASKIFTDLIQYHVYLKQRTQIIASGFKIEKWNEFQFDSHVFGSKSRIQN